MVEVLGRIVYRTSRHGAISHVILSLYLSDLDHYMVLDGFSCRRNDPAALEEKISSSF